MQQPPIYQHNRLTATGNLDYIRFMRVVQKTWIDTHPDIPLIAAGGPEVSKYPVITYRLAYRNTVKDETKPRYRETIATRPQDSAIVNKGQRFNNYITFTVWTERDPHLAEAIIEQFEDFMLEMTPVYKQLGVSDIFYGRREPDTEDQRPLGKIMHENSVTFQVITEKIIQVDYNKLNTVYVNIQTYLASNPVWLEEATPTIYLDIIDQFSGSTPN
jgi:hypothetical protein